jgi:putative SbcD/Mre11-related phosphoesterase
MVQEITIPEGIILNPGHAVYCLEDEILAITDLHLGYEASLQVEHVAIPRFQLEPMLSRLEKLLNKYNPKSIIINGDMKHEFSRNIGQEWDEVIQVIEILGEWANPIIIRGNHDNYLKTIVSRTGIEVLDSYIPESGVMEFVHGHKSIKPKSKFRVYGHEHPVIRLKDEIGAMITLPSFLYDKINNFLIMPAFSPLASGTNLLSSTETFMIEEIRNLDLSSAKVYAIGEEGILDFGELGNLRNLNESDIE